MPLVLALGVQFASQAEVGPAQPDLASYRYPDADLGAAYSPAATQFKLWAPTATAVAVVLYADATQAATVTVPLQRSPTGIWSGSIAGDCQGKYYQYAITHPSTTTHQRLTEAARLEQGITQGLLRLSAGLEDASDLVEDIEGALGAL